MFHFGGITDSPRPYQKTREVWTQYKLLLCAVICQSITLKLVVSWKSSSMTNQRWFQHYKWGFSAQFCLHKSEISVVLIFCCLQTFIFFSMHTTPLHYTNQDCNTVELSTCSSYQRDWNQIYGDPCHQVYYLPLLVGRWTPLLGMWGSWRYTLVSGAHLESILDRHRVHAPP